MRISRHLGRRRRRRLLPSLKRASHYPEIRALNRRQNLYQRDAEYWLRKCRSARQTGHAGLARMTDGTGANVPAVDLWDRL